MDSSGNLYGTTSNGGPVGRGTVFELLRGTDTLTPLATFNIANGSDPEAGLVMDSSGNLYGTTRDGGPSGSGTVFELAHGSSTITTLASFNGTNGDEPQADLIMDGSGNLYGSTPDGGPSDDGTIFELARGSGTITTLASFNGTNGSSPATDLIMDDSGNLYGTTSGGGSSDNGTVFELAHGSGTTTTLASFNGTNGSGAQGDLIMDTSGNLYGTTRDGGASDDGTVFELAHGSNTITAALFNGTNGRNPVSGLVMDSSGNLYGTTTFGGSSDNGVVFELAHGSSSITTLASFTVAGGFIPFGGLVMDSSGNLYGTTHSGGPSNYGTVFELQLAPSFEVTTLADAGPGSLRAAITAVNSDPIDNGTDQITFASNIQNESIVLQSALPALRRDQVTITGPVTVFGTDPISGNQVTGDGLEILGNQDTIEQMTFEEFNGDGISIYGNNNSIQNDALTLNTGNGVTVLSGTGNSILQDQIYGNTGMPIELGTNGLNSNSLAGSHSGPNDLQNYPIITSALQSDGSTQVQGYLNSSAITTFTIETYYIWSSGSILLNSQQVTTDAQGNAATTPFTLSLPEDTPPGGIIEGTATDPNGNTSEYGLALTPAQIRTAYGINDLSFDGSGQTIAIIAFDNDPNILTELDTFDRQFGTIASGPSLYSQYNAAAKDVTVLAYDQNGNAINPGILPSTTSAEEAMDVEWAHAIAPGAHIDVVECSSVGGSSSLIAAIKAADVLPDVSVVSMSIGFNEAGAPQTNPPQLTVTASEEQQDDPSFISSGKTFLAASGDFGLYDKSYPAFSPTVVAVGGTILSLNPDGTYSTEQGWGAGTNSAIEGGSGGGSSLGGFEKEPAFQLGVQKTGQRTIPDVSMIGGTQVAVSESVNRSPGNRGWIPDAGTSLATPLWAGLLALVNQGRTAAGQTVLNGTNPQETLTALYDLPSSDFHDNLGGSNGTTADGLVSLARYDEVTGLGTPIANLLVPALVAWKPVSIAPASLQAGTVGVAYKQTLTASGAGGGSYAFAVTSGTLPSGLTLDTSTGILSGVVTASGSFNFVVTAADQFGATGSQSYALTINPVTATSPPTSPSSPPSSSTPAPPLNLEIPSLLALVDQLLGATETVNADGSATDTVSLFGFPVLVSTFDSSGKLVSVTLFGFNVTFLFELL